MNLPGHPSGWSDDALLEQCTRQQTRRSGPGGQHRNKVETAIVLTHGPTGVRAAASERRSQAENLRVALRRLRVLLALAVRQPATERPAAVWVAHCRQRRIAVRPTHADYAPCLAQALDAVAQGPDTASAAAFLECTPSQLVRFLKDEPDAYRLFNAWRVARGEPRLS